MITQRCREAPPDKEECADGCEAIDITATKKPAERTAEKETKGRDERNKEIKRST